MTNLSGMNNAIKTIESIIKKLENSKVTSEELDELVENTQKLYERAIILRYKTYEEKIFGEKPAEIAPEINEPIVEIKAVPEELPEIDFSLFGSEEDFAMDNDEKEEESPIAEVEIVSEIEEKIEEEQIDTPELIEEQVEAHVVETVMVENSPISNNKFIQKHSRMDSANAGFVSKLDTLVGAFGLNERLQYINELFDGSSEAFSEAVKAIDKQADLHQALSTTAHYAHQFSWENDSETVDEFVTKIKRKHA